jgi:SAM-dependent methyltransferase
VTGAEKICRMAEPYATLAPVYEWLVPDALVEPEGAVAAFADVVGHLPADARVLDCAAGTGELAVGLALRGFDATATDASTAMIGRTRALAERHGVALHAAACAWEDLPAQGWSATFDAVFCVGNSLAHAPGQAARRAALAAMAGTLKPSGLLAVTSRNWELIRRARPRLEVADRLIERHGRRGLVIYAWAIADAWDDPHDVDIAVTVIDAAGGATTQGERLTLWPFTHEALHDDLRSAGLAPAASTYEPDVGRYLVTARRR